MASVQYEETTHAIHPAFNSIDGNVILRSAEETAYRLPAFVLRTTSSVFRAMLPSSQPPCRGGGAHILDTIEIEENDVVVERLLRMISGMEISKWESFDELEAVLVLAEKWGMPGPVSVIRSAITAPKFLADPLRLYGITTRYGWEEEAKLASTYTLKLSIYDTKYMEKLYKIPGKDLMELLSFHRRRRDIFKAIIDSGEYFNAGNSTDNYCSGCGEKTDNHTWRELKARMFSELDERPSGETFLGLDMEEWPESIACWNAKCHKKGCERENYNKSATIRDIQKCLDQLPSTI